MASKFPFYVHLIFSQKKNKQTNPNCLLLFQHPSEAPAWQLTGTWYRYTYLCGVHMQAADLKDLPHTHLFTIIGYDNMH